MVKILHIWLFPDVCNNATVNKMVAEAIINMASSILNVMTLCQIKRKLIIIYCEGISVLTAIFQISVTDHIYKFSPTSFRTFAGCATSALDSGSKWKIREPSSNSCLGFLHSLTSRYHWERYECIAFPSYNLNSRLF